MEKISETDEDLMGKYLDGKEIEIAELKKALRKAVINYEIVPVFCGSALKNKGVQLVLDAVLDYLPSPLDLEIIKPVKGTHPKTGEEIIRLPKDDEPLAALAFKIASDPYVGSLTFFRIYSGILKRGTYVLNPASGETERVGRILRMHANQREEVEEVYAGDLGALVGLKKLPPATLCATRTTRLFWKE